jgi:uncharacterized protein YjbI with pentapeptide repeats
LGEGNNHKNLLLPGCDFSGADLTGCSFVGSDLSDSIFQGAQLDDCNFARADLVSARFDRANLFGCNLNLADCNGASFESANLSCASLFGTDLSDSILTNVNLTGARLKGVLLTGAVAKRVELDDTAFSELDLSVFATARFRKSGSSCDVDWSAIAQSLCLPDDILKTFLIKIGMPDSIAMWQIEAAKALDPRQVFSLMQSTFISYGGPDEPFAAALRDELNKNQVRTFLFRDNALPGERLHRMMRDGVNDFDRVILICSRASLERPGVLNEIEETLQREARNGAATYLIPIRLDNYVFDGWKPPNAGVAQAVRDRVVADFRASRRSRSALRKSILPLLRALRKKKPV